MRSDPLEIYPLMFLSCASGCTDVMAFLKLGDVFTSGMTGNVALLAIAISQGHMLAASHSLLAFLGFVSGVVITTVIYNPDPGNARKLARVRPLFLLEIACLLGFALLWHSAETPSEGFPVFVLILFSALGMGIQGVAARNVGPSGISTIVFTSTLINIVMTATQSCLHRLPPPSAAAAALPLQQTGTFVAYGVGAILSGILVWHHWSLFAWVPLVCVLAALGCYELAHRHRHD